MMDESGGIVANPNYITNVATQGALIIGQLRWWNTDEEIAEAVRKVGITRPFVVKTFEVNLCNESNERNGGRPANACVVGETDGQVKRVYACGIFRCRGLQNGPFETSTIWY